MQHALDHGADVESCANVLTVSTHIGQESGNGWNDSTSARDGGTLHTIS